MNDNTLLNALIRYGKHTNTENEKRLDYFRNEPSLPGEDRSFNETIPTFGGFVYFLVQEDEKSKGE